jgi:hypothetical protein
MGIFLLQTVGKRGFPARHEFLQRAHVEIAVVEPRF